MLTPFVAREIDQCPRGRCLDGAPRVVLGRDAAHAAVRSGYDLVEVRHGEDVHAFVVVDGEAHRVQLRVAA